MGKQAMSQQQEMADSVFERLKKEPVSLAVVVWEIREKWGVEFGVPEVHGFVREVATCLLHHQVEVGDVIDHSFVPWDLEPWDADEKIDHELMSMEVFLEDESRYVFWPK